MVLAAKKLTSICGALDKVTLELVSNNGVPTPSIEAELDEIEQVFTNDIAGNRLYIGVRIKSLRGLLEDAKHPPSHCDEDEL
jgi:hypothetical protein